MKNPTIKEIKEMFPEGCEVHCAWNPKDKGVVNYNTLRKDSKGDAFFLNNNTIYLFDWFRDTFATIIKPAPENFSKIVFFDPKKEMQTFVREDAKKDFNKAFNNKLDKMKEELIRDLIKYMDSI